MKNDPQKVLTAERIEDLFASLDTGLGSAGLGGPVEIMIAGGAAVAMLWNPRRITYDVDIVSEGIPEQFWRVVAALGRDAELGEDWLNSAARLKAPTGATLGTPVEVYRGSNLRVFAASPHFVLAMKLLSGREVDRRDMPALLDAVRPKSADELFELVEQAYPIAQIPASTRYIIEAVWADYTANML